MQDGKWFRACVCLKNANTGDGHAIIAENNDGNVQFLDVQVGKYYNEK